MLMNILLYTTPRRLVSSQVEEVVWEQSCCTILKIEAERSSPTLVVIINQTGNTPVEFSLLNITQFTTDIHSLNVSYGPQIFWRKWTNLL